MYSITNKRGELLTMRDGTPFVYTTFWTAQLGLAYLKAEHTRLKTPKNERPLRVVPA